MSITLVILAIGLGLLARTMFNLLIVMALFSEYSKYMRQFADSRGITLDEYEDIIILDSWSPIKGTRNLYSRIRIVELMVRRERGLKKND